MRHSSTLFCILFGLLTSSCVKTQVTLQEKSHLETDPPKVISMSQEVHHAIPYSGADNLHVFVSFLVDGTGQIANPVVTQKTDENIRQQALQALNHIRFEPGRSVIQPVNFEMTLPVSFRGKNNSPALSDFLDQIPILLGTVEQLVNKIEYPERARRAGLEGQVTIAFIIDQNGHVRFPTVTQRLGAGCDEEALQAVQSMRFLPAQLDGSPVNVITSLTFIFKLT